MLRGEIEGVLLLVVLRFQRTVKKDHGVFEQGWSEKINGHFSGGQFWD